MRRPQKFEVIFLLVLPLQFSNVKTNKDFSSNFLALAGRVSVKINLLCQKSSKYFILFVFRLSQLNKLWTVPMQLVENEEQIVSRIRRLNKKFIFNFLILKDSCRLNSKKRSNVLLLPLVQFSLHQSLNSWNKEQLRKAHDWLYLYH